MSRSRCRTVQFLILAFALSTFVTACGSKKARKHWWQVWRPKKPAAPVYAPDEVFAPPPEPQYTEGDAANLGAGTIYDVDPASGQVLGYKETRAPEGKEASVMITSLPTVYFAFDSDTLQPQEQEVLDRCVEWLLAHPDVTVQVEGHCDERGTPEYNLNLGQRRADKVREYLIQKGVAPTQLVSISYGEERPIDLGKTEEAYGKNRRVQFLIYE